MMMEQLSHIVTTTTLGVEPSDRELVELASKIEAIINEGRQKLAVSIVRVTKETYWNIGRHIVEFEQGGNARAKYGSELLTMLARILRIRVGRGYSRPNLYNMRKFYLTYPDYQVSSEDSAPIFQTSGKSDTPIIQTSDKLTWSHICELITIDDPMERSFYEKECVANSWSAVTLHRQKESGLFMRLAISRDKEGVLQLATQGQQVQTPSDVVKDHYTLEFLGLADKTRYKESDLEARLIDNMQMFLLELGKGFTFVKRQYALTISNVHYHIDLVFYHLRSIRPKKRSRAAQRHWADEHVHGLLCQGREFGRRQPAHWHHSWPLQG